MSRADWAMLIASVVFNVGASAMLKVSAGQVGEISLQQWNVSSVGGMALGIAIACYGFAFLAYLLALRTIPVSVAYPLITSLTTLALALVATLVLGETISPKGILGIALVLAGVALLA